MKNVSNAFKEQIKMLGRELDSKIRYYRHFNITTEDSYALLSEDGKPLLTEEVFYGGAEPRYIEIGNEDLYNIKLIKHGDLMKTLMKELNFESTQDLKLNSIVEYLLGVKVNGDYEYINYDKFIVYKKDYNEDTNRYTYVAYDSMINTMKPFKFPQRDIDYYVEYPMTMWALAVWCCSYCGLSPIDDFPHNNYGIGYDTFHNLLKMNLTYRDVLDYICEVAGIGIVSDYYGHLVALEPNQLASINLFDLSNGIVSDNRAYYNYDIDTNSFTLGVDGPVSAYINTRFYCGEITSNTTYIKFDYENLTGSNELSWYYRITPTSSYDSSSPTFNGGNNTSLTINTTDYIGQYLWVHLRNNVSRNEAYSKKFNKFIVSTNEIGEHYEPYGIYTLYEDSFKDTGIKFEKLYGPINSVKLEVNELAYVSTDDTSSKANGLTQIVIKNNPLIESEQAPTLVNNILSYVKDLSYYTNDLSSTGICYLEYYDLFNVNIKNKTYPCMLLNDEIKISQGLEESIFTEEPQLISIDYDTSNYSNEDLSYIVDSNNTQRILKINSYGEVVACKINENADKFSTYDFKGIDITTDSETRIEMRPKTIKWFSGRGYLEATNYQASPVLNFKSEDGSITSISAYGITTPNVTQTSSEDKKKNFTKFENGLDILKNVDIYKYNFKNESNGDKKHIGFVIGDNFKYRREITDKKNENVELYSMVSVLWQAVKELQKEIEELKERKDNK